jgi:hypothetical protein
VPQTSYHFICTSTGNSHAVEERDLVGRAQRPALGAGAVVAVDVDDQRVVELAQVLEGLDHAADLVVAVGGVGGEDLDLADEQLLLVGGELSQGFSTSFGQGVSLASRGITPELLLVLEDASRAASRSRRRTGASR